MDRQSEPNIHILRGPEHAAMERLLRASDLCATARTFLDVGGDHTRVSSRQGAVTTLLLLGPVTPRLGAALVAAATRRPGGAAQLVRVSRDVERTLREMPPLPDSHRIARLPGGGGIVEDTLSELLRETALELHDIDLAYSVNDAGEHVFTWREAPQRIVEVMLLETLMLKIDLMLMSDARLGFEHAAGAWWYKQAIIDWPSETAAGSAGWRMREWTQADRVLASLGMTAAEALPHHELWGSLSARQRELVRAFAKSIPGLFAARKATARGVIVEDVFDGHRYELVSDEEPASGNALMLGRLIPRDGGVHLASPGTVTFETSAELPDLRALLRNHAGRGQRGLAAELTMGRLTGGIPRDDHAIDLTPAEAAEMLSAYERGGRVTKGFRAAALKASALDDATSAWITLLRERAAPRTADSSLRS